jgi:hypothetical protein
MDAYDLQKKIFSAWQDLSHRSDAATINKQWSEVPIYVEVGNKQYQVIDMKIEGQKVILKVSDE